MSILIIKHMNQFDSVVIETFRIYDSKERDKRNISRKLTSRKYMMTEYSSQLL